jgi:hypothetical protein
MRAIADIARRWTRQAAALALLVAALTALIGTDSSLALPHTAPTIVASINAPDAPCAPDADHDELCHAAPGHTLDVLASAETPLVTRGPGWRGRSSDILAGRILSPGRKPPIA